MACDFDDLMIIDDEFIFGDAHRKCLTDFLPGDGVEVLPICNVSFDVDDPVEYLSSVVG